MNKKQIKIGFFGDGPWAHLSLEKILKMKNISVCFICLRYGSEDPVLADMGNKSGIDVLCHQNINSDEFFGIMEKYHADLFVSMSFNQIFKKKMIDYPPLSTINCHAGKLPYYRGRNILNWALINDEKEFGITVHYVDEGIDTGDIILQDTFPITDEDNYATLLERAYTGCSELLTTAVKQIADGTAGRIKQNDIDPVGMYCGIRTAGDEITDWKKSSRELFNFIRAITRPGPGALSYIKNEPIIIFKARMIEGARPYINTPGQIIGRSDEGFIIKTGDTVLEITDYEYNGKIRIGDRLKRTKSEENI